MAGHVTDEYEASMVRVELRYCPRCGALRVPVVGALEQVCDSCERIFAWLRKGSVHSKKRRRRRARAAQGDRT